MPQEYSQQIRIFQKNKLNCGVLELFQEDQCAICDPNMRLSDLRAQLPKQLLYHAPNINICLGDWLRAGGLGMMVAPPVRRDVLGIRYRSANQTEAIEVGGRVVKNVQGYDVVRALVGHDPSLSSQIVFERITIRLRPTPKIVQRNKKIEATKKQETLQELQALLASYAFVYEKADQCFAYAEWWSEDLISPNWGDATTSVLEISEAAKLEDLLGPFPRQEKKRNSLEQKILNAF